MEYMKDLVTGVKLGMFAYDGIWIYYMEARDGNSLYRIKTDGTCKAKMSGKSLGSYIKLEGDWQYYQVLEEGSEDYFFYRIRKDGTGEIKISDEKVYVEFVVKDDWIYFTEGKNLKKMHTDGTCTTQLGINHMGCLALKGQNLYFGNIGFLGGLTKIGVDGTGQKLISSVHPTRLAVSDDWIFYTDYESSDKLWKMSMNGAGKCKITDTPVFLINIVGDWLYYMNFNEEKVYRISINENKNENVL